MPQYRERETGIIKSNSEVRKIHKNTSFSKVVDTFADLGWDEIVAVNMPPESSPMKKVVEGTPIQINNKWTQVWFEEDKFSTDEKGIKAEKEAAYQVELDTNTAIGVRQERDIRLKETDWLGLSDITMSTEWVTYRQELRDIPEQAEFPNTIIWPTEPS